MNFDVFFSYRRAELSTAQPLLEALQRTGVRVWLDKAAMPDLAPITEEIRRGLAASKALLAFYSAAYPLSRACQEELTAAWLAAEQAGDVPYRRVLLINPESPTDGDLDRGSIDHIPASLRAHSLMTWGVNEAALQMLATRIAQHLATLEGTLEGAGIDSHSRFYGMASVEAPRFVGRVREMWELHSLLTASRMRIVSGTFGQSTVQIRGIGGVGKSLFAREYAIRFGRAYPGGVFWLNAYGNDDANEGLDAAGRAAARLDQISQFAVDLGIDTTGLTPEQVESALWRWLDEQRQPCLWIVDDLPSGLSLRELERCWNARWPGASTLITTRSTARRADV